jgi:ATP-dependent DNA ligase
MAEQDKSSFLNRLKDATNTIATRAREEVEELQTRHELSQAYNDLGRTAAELVESGAVSHPELASRVKKIRELKAQLAAAASEPESSEPAAAEPAATEPAATEPAGPSQPADQ